MLVAPPRIAAAIAGGLLSVCLVASAQEVAPKPPPAAERVLENYYGNTLVCAAAITGNDLCHLWLNRDGTFINIDPTGGHAGHYRVGPVRADGKIPVCLKWNTPNLVMPPEIGLPATERSARKPPAGAPPRPPEKSASGAPPLAMMCKTAGFRTTCTRVDPATLSVEDRKIAMRTMGERFHNGMCYPLAPRSVGDTWFEDDDPLPGQAGKDKLLLLPGRR
jgi:hypothetical protein